MSRPRRDGGLRSAHDPYPNVIRHGQHDAFFYQSALVPWIVNVVGMVPSPAPDDIVVPFMNQMATSPLVSCHTMSLAPLPSKSPVSATLHTVDRLPTPAVLGLRIVVPFISQIAMLPEVSRHRMSLLPSALKSPVPATDHAAGMLPNVAVLEFRTVVPFISQIATLPLLLRHKMSALPSPLKSPTPTTVQFSGTLPRPEVLGLRMVVALISQIAISPVEVLRHRMSAMPSPLKSPVPTMDHAVGTLPRPEVLGLRMVVPFISQIAKSP